MMMDVMARLGPRLLCGDVPKVRDACTTSVLCGERQCVRSTSCRRAVTAYRLEAVCVSVCICGKSKLIMRGCHSVSCSTRLFAVVCVSLCILYSIPRSYYLQAVYPTFSDLASKSNGRTKSGMNEIPWY